MGYQPQPQDNSNNSGNSVPRLLLLLNVKRTYFSGPSLLIPGMHLLTRPFSVMTVPWELRFAPRELHQKEMSIFGVSLRQKWERKRTGRRKGKQPTMSIRAKSTLDLISKGP